MKVKELIELLQKENPEDEVICGGDGPIYHLEAKPGYYDGYPPFLIQDPTNQYYNIIGYEWKCQDKVIISTMNLEECLYSCNSQKDIDNFIIRDGGKPWYKEFADKMKNKVKESFKEIGIE